MNAQAANFEYPFLNKSGFKMFYRNFLKEKVQELLSEDLLTENFYYLKELPQTKIQGQLKIKSSAMIAGLDAFEAVFNYLGGQVEWTKSRPVEGKFYGSGTAFTMALPANVALSGERLALNLLAHASQVATFTQTFVAKAAPHGIRILDTRKTTPGLRWLEKYAVRLAGGHNHRMGQTDVWMIKDNHKKIFGGLTGAHKFFSNLGTQYNPIHAEIHNLNEFKEALDLGLKFLMLDNFSVDEIKQVTKDKPASVVIELSGGINQTNLEQYLIKGVDAISLGCLTHSAPHLDFSLKLGTNL